MAEMKEGGKEAGGVEASTEETVYAWELEGSFTSAIARTGH